LAEAAAGTPEAPVAKTVEEKQLQGRPKASTYRGVLLELIVESNSDLSWLKGVYGPHKLGKV
jgi:hypothetical protein